MSITSSTRMAAALLLALLAVFAAPPPAAADRYVSTNGPRWLVLVDDLHLDFRRTGQIRETLATAVRPLVLSGVLLRLRTSGPSAVALHAHDETSWNDVRGPLRQVTGNALKAEDIVRMRDTRAGRRELVARARATVATARRLLGAAGTRPAVLLLVSQGYRTDIPEVSAELIELAALAGRPRADCRAGSAGACGHGRVASGHRVAASRVPPRRHGHESRAPRATDRRRRVGGRGLADRRALAVEVAPRPSQDSMQSCAADRAGRVRIGTTP